MKNTLFISAAAALVLAAPAAAKPGGHGDGRGFDYGYEREHADHDFALGDPVGYGVGGCPPGLARKHNGCMPPGQAKKHELDRRFAHQPTFWTGHRR